VLTEHHATPARARKRSNEPIFELAMLARTRVWRGVKPALAGPAVGSGDRFLVTVLW
jgi:hypothetical protein